MSKPFFEFEITGRGVSPETIYWDDLCDVVASLKDATCAVAEREGFADREDAFFCLIGIEKGSTRLRIAVIPVLLAATATISNAIDSNDYTRLPFRSHEALHRLSNKAAAKKWTVGFVGNAALNIAAAHLSVEAPVPQPPAEALARGTTTVFGRCLRVGGARTPRAEIRLMSGELIHIDVSETMARQLARCLYEEVALRGDATWDSEGKMVAFRVDSLTEYERTDPVDAFQRLATAAGTHWEQINAQEFVSNLRYGEGQ